MKIEKRIYKVLYKGKQFSLPFCIVVDYVRREKVLVKRKQR